MIDATDNNQMILSNPNVAENKQSGTEEISKLLNQVPILESGEYFSYQNLLKEAIAQELNENHRELKKLFDDASQTNDQKKEAFKALCKRREEKNQNSCLSFTDFPDGSCNRLYWEIAQKLFEPKTLTEMLGIIQPSIRHLLEIELNIKEANYANPQKLAYKLSLVKKELHQINERDNHSKTFSIEQMGCFVTLNHLLFDLRDLQKFSFDLHHQLYQALAYYPEIQREVYQRSPDLKKLLEHLKLYQKEGRKPREMIAWFVSELEASGEHRSHQTYASTAAEKALKEFDIYLEALPFKLRQQIKALRSDVYSRSLNDILAHLYQGNCVEQAANYLKSLLENLNNPQGLDTRPSLALETLQEIRKQYGHNKELPIVGSNLSKQLPAAQRLSPPLLKRVLLKNQCDFVYLLQNVEANDYDELLAHVTLSQPPLPYEELMMEAFSEDWISEEKKTAFFKALINNEQRFGGTEGLLQFAWNIKSALGISVILSSIEEGKRLNFVNSVASDEEGVSLLQKAACGGFLQIITALLNALPDEKTRLEAIKYPIEQGGYNALHRASPESIPCLLNYLSDNSRIDALYQKVDKGYNVLHLCVRADFSEHITALLACFPKERHLEILGQRTDDNDHIFQLTKKRSSRALLLKTLSEQDILDFLHQKNSRGNPLVLEILDDQDSYMLDVILNKITKERFIELIIKEDIEYGSVLENFAKYSFYFDGLDYLICNLPEQRLVDVLTHKNQEGIPPLFHAIMYVNLNALELLIKKIPEQHIIDTLGLHYLDRPLIQYVITQLEEKEKNSLDIFNILLDYCSDFIADTISSLPKERRLVFLNIQTNDDCTILEKLINKLLDNSTPSSEQIIASLVNEVSDSVQEDFQIESEIVFQEQDELLIKPELENGELRHSKLFTTPHQEKNSKHKLDLTLPEIQVIDEKSSINQKVDNIDDVDNNTPLTDKEKIIKEGSDQVHKTTKIGTDIKNLLTILETLKHNISTQQRGRKTTRNSEWKINLLVDIENQLNQEDAVNTDINGYVTKIDNVCAMKRNSLHFWSEPHSVSEFALLRKQYNLIDVPSQIKLPTSAT